MAKSEGDRKRSDPRREPTDPDIRLDQKDIDRAKRTLEQLARLDDDSIPSPATRRSIRPTQTDIQLGDLDEHLASIADNRRKQIQTHVQAGQFSRALAILDEERSRFPKTVSIARAIASVKEIASRTYAARLNRLELVPMVGRPQALEGPMSEGIRMVIHSIDGVSSFEDIVRTSPLGRMKTLEILADLFDRRVLVIKPQTESTRPKPRPKPSVRPDRPALSIENTSKPPPAVVEKPVENETQSDASPANSDAEAVSIPSLPPEPTIPRPPRMPGRDLALSVRSQVPADLRDEPVSRRSEVDPSATDSNTKTYVALAACAALGAVGLTWFAKQQDPSAETPLAPSARATSAPSVKHAAPTATQREEITLSVEVSPREAWTYLDDQPLIGASFQRKLPRDGRVHTVRVEAHGYKKTVQTFVASADVTLVLSLEPLPRPAPAKTASPQEDAGTDPYE
jgi:hypothetical protein